MISQASRGVPTIKQALRSKSNSTHAYYHMKLSRRPRVSVMVLKY